MSIHPTENGRWTVRWREGERNRSRTFDLKSDAKDFESLTRRKGQLGESIPARTGTVALDAYFLRWMELKKQTLAPRTLASYAVLFKAHVHHQIGYVPLKNIDAERMEDWQAERLKAGAGRQSINRTRTMLSQVFKKAVRDHHLSANPIDGMEPVATERERLAPLSVLDIERIRHRFIMDGRLGDAILVELQAYGGMRFGEALAVTWENFSLGSRFWVEHNLEDDGSLKDTKNGVHGFAFLPAPAAEDVLLWRRQVSPFGFVIPRAKDGKGWTKTDRNNWRRRHFNPTLEALSISRVPVKNLRHTAASLRISSGKRPTEVAEELRHSLQVSITVYQRLMREMEGQPIRPMDDVIREARERVVKALDPTNVQRTSDQPRDAKDDKDAVNTTPSKDGDPA